MNIQQLDTNPVVEEILINLSRQKSIPEKFSIIDSLSSLAIRLSKRAIKRKNPQLPKQQLDLLFVKLNYGEELYNKVRLYINLKRGDK